MSEERRQENVDYEKNYYNPRAYDNKQKKAQKLVKWKNGKNVSVKTKKENDRSSRERADERAEEKKRMRFFLGADVGWSNGRVISGVDGRLKEVSVTPTNAIKWINYANRGATSLVRGRLVNNADRIISLWKMYGSHELARACMRVWYTVDARHLLQREGMRAMERDEGKEKGSRGKERLWWGKEEKSVTRKEREKRGREKYAGRWTTARMHADRVDAAPWIFVHETRSRERNTASSHPALEDR